MIKNIGIEIPKDIYDILKNEKILAIMTTFSDKGMPYMTPLSTIYPKNNESILIAILAENTGYKNMVWQKKVVISLIEPNNLCVHMIGRSGIVRAPSKVHPLINIAQIDIIDVIYEDSLLVSIESKIKWKHISPEMKNLHDSLMRELQECANVI